MSSSEIFSPTSLYLHCAERVVGMHDCARNDWRCGRHWTGAKTAAMGLNIFENIGKIDWLSAVVESNCFEHLLVDRSGIDNEFPVCLWQRLWPHDVRICAGHTSVSIHLQFHLKKKKKKPQKI
jgi:hypothetical protein